MPRLYTGLKIILWLTITLAGISLPAQDPSHLRDSLFRTISAPGNDNRINAYNALAKSYWNSQNDSAIFYAESALDLASRLDNHGGEAEANRIIGVTKWYQQKKPEEIRPYLETALHLYKTAGITKGIADTYNNLGSFYNYAGNKPLSLLFYDSSLSLFRKLKDKKGEAAVLNYIGIVYQYMGEFSKAIDYTLQ